MSDNCTLNKQYHAQKGMDIYVVKIIPKIEKDDFVELRRLAREWDGYYSSFRGVNGFVFKSETDGKAFMDSVEEFLFSSDIVNLDFDSSFSEVNNQKTFTPEVKLKRESKNNQNENEVTASNELSHNHNLRSYLKEIVQKEGKEILKNQSLISYLEDFKVFEDKPSYRFIVRSIINEGFMESLLNLSTWEDVKDLTIRNFTKITEISYETTKYVFDSIAYSLGLTQQEDGIKDQSSDNIGIPEPIVEESVKKNKKTKSKRSNKSDDLVEIMKRAVSGDIDAIKHCATLGIDPFNSETEFFEDYSLLRIGDYVYHDWTFSHKKSSLKKPIGMVFSLETSDLEKSEGWNNGKIVAIKDFGESAWGENEELSFPHSHYSFQDMDNLKENPHLFQDYKSEFLIRNSNFGIFKYVKKFKLALPKEKTSGWYLPSIAQAWELLNNLTVDQKDNISLNNQSCYWTSSQSNSDNACYWFNSGDFNSYGINLKLFQERVRLICSF